METITKWALPAPVPYLAVVELTGDGLRYVGPPACPTCGGQKVTGERAECRPGNSDRVLLVDVICPSCLGCGRADHQGCSVVEHATGDDIVFEEDDEPSGDEDLDSACPSCRGRGWWSCQGFNDTRVVDLRMPCGCAESTLVQVPDVPDGQG